MISFYSWLARSSTRHRWWFLGAWAAILALAAVGAGSAEHALRVGGFSLPGTQFHAASAILAADLKMSSDKTALVVFHSEDLLVTDKRFHDAIEHALAN